MQQGMVATTLWLHDEVGHNQEGRQELKELFDDKGYFDGPKPVRLLKRILKVGAVIDNDIVLDFFSGSGSTAHALMELNAEDGGNRQSISVQLPEKLEENSEAYKAGYRTIADITRARIEKVIAKLKAEHPEKTEGLACANFTLAPSNFQVWNSDISDHGAIRQQLDALQNTEKAPDEQIAMLTELLLKNGLGALGVHAISKPRKLACGITVHRVLREDDRYLWLCFEPYVEALRDEILSASPAQVIMLNSCFVGAQGDEQLSNLQLDLAAQDISLLVI
nr:DNA methyltransferase [Halomonas sp.]